MFSFSVFSRIYTLLKSQFSISRNPCETNSSLLKQPFALMTFLIRNFNPQDYQTVRDWGNNISWNLGTYEHLAFKLLDHNTYWIGQLDGKPIASVAISHFGHEFAFIGLYLCVPEHQGKGYAYKVWQQALKHINVKNIALQGSESQQSNYMKSGFKTQHKTLCFITNRTGTPYHNDNLVDCNEIDFQILNEFDCINFPVERKEFLKKWITLPESKSIAYMRNNQIEGYGVLRVSADGYRLGPLYANSYEVAQEILKNLAGQAIPNSEITLDIPEVNEQAVKLAEAWHMTKDCEYARMYTNGPPKAPMDKSVYATTSLEIG